MKYQLYNLQAIATHIDKYNRFCVAYDWDTIEGQKTRDKVRKHLNKYSGFNPLTKKGFTVKIYQKTQTLNRESLLGYRIKIEAYIKPYSYTNNKGEEINGWHIEAQKITIID